MSSDLIPDYRYPPDSSTPGVADDPEDFREQVRAYLRLRAERGGTYVKSNQIAKALGASVQKVGCNMPALAEEGAIESWGGKQGGVWRITLDEEDDDG